MADLPAEGLDPAAIAALMVGATAAAEVEDEALATAVGLDVGLEQSAPEPGGAGAGGRPIPARGPGGPTRSPWPATPARGWTTSR